MNTKNIENETPLSQAVIFRPSVIEELLLVHGADSLSGSIREYIALEPGANSEDNKIAELLKQYGYSADGNKVTMED